MLTNRPSVFAGPAPQTDLYRPRTSNTIGRYRLAKAHHGWQVLIADSLHFGQNPARFTSSDREFLALYLAFDRDNDQPGYATPQDAVTAFNEAHSLALASVYRNDLINA